MPNPFRRKTGTRPPSQQQNAIGEDTRASQRHRGTPDGVLLALTVAKNATDFVPAVKSVLGGVSEVMNICQVRIYLFRYENDYRQIMM